MIFSFSILALALASVAAGFAIIAHRRSAGSTTTQWGARASLLLSMAIILGTTPALIFPSSQWLRLAGSLMSLVLTGASLSLLRRVRRGAPRSTSHRQLPNEG
jgi:hypothetical protein